MMRRLLLALALMGVIWAAPAVAAPSATGIAEQLRCVDCGTSLDVSDAPAARQMKVRIAREIASAAPIAVRWTKRSLYRNCDWDPVPAAESEAQLQSRTFETEDSKEGVAALLEKRAPVFKGR